MKITSSAATSMPSVPTSKGYLVRNSAPLFATASPMVLRALALTRSGKKYGIRDMLVPESPASVDQVHATVSGFAGVDHEGGTGDMIDQ